MRPYFTVTSRCRARPDPLLCAQLLGAVKRANTGFSTAAHSVDRLHTGFIYQCPLVQQTRNEDRMKAQRKVGAKVALAARVDMAKSAPTGSFGEEMKGKLEGEMERLARPAPSKVTKALPRPDAQKKNRRGGKRCVDSLPPASLLAPSIKLTQAYSHSTMHAVRARPRRRTRRPSCASCRTGSSSARPRRRWARTTTCRAWA